MGKRLMSVSRYVVVQQIVNVCNVAVDAEEISDKEDESEPVSSE